jgi:predicted RNA binding protein YcfA (HicA-like mRNA interferase family)
MKRKDLIKLLTEEGCILKRSGGRHDIYFNPKNGMQQPVPRHTEINEVLAKHILKYLGIYGA